MKFNDLTPIEHRKQIEKQQEFKFLGTAVKKRGQKLYAFDTTSEEVYEVQVQERKILEINKKNQTGKWRAVINPKHPMLYAINKKNAVKKFLKNLQLIESMNVKKNEK